MLSLHPLCQICIEHECITEATEVHHKVPYLRGKDDVEKWKLFLDERNLLCVCNKCHKKLHKLDKAKHMARLEYLNDKEWREAHNVIDYDDEED